MKVHGRGEARRVDVGVDGDGGEENILVELWKAFC